MGDMSVQMLSCTEAVGVSTDSLVCETEYVAGVPLTLVYDSRTKHAGPQPMLLYGYGAYGTRLEPMHSPKHMALLRRGWTIGFAHVRGGGELGRAWHDAGRLDR